MSLPLELKNTCLCLSFYSFQGWCVLTRTTPSPSRARLERSYPFFFIPGGCAPRTPCSGGRAGDPFPAHCFFRLFGDHILDIIFFICLVPTLSFVFHFLGVYRPRELPHRFKHKILRRMNLKLCLGTPWEASYEHICKNLYFCKC